MRNILSPGPTNAMEYKVLTFSPCGVDACPSFSAEMLDWSEEGEWVLFTLHLPQHVA